MPRQARLDAPGVFQHVMARGIERRKIFWDDKDRSSFLERLAVILEETQTQCYAWALIPNHFHILLRIGATPLSTVMRRLMTGYAVHSIFVIGEAGTFSRIVTSLLFVKKTLRNVDEITSSAMHHSFRPPSFDLKSQKS